MKQLKRLIFHSPIGSIVQGLACRLDCYEPNIRCQLTDDYIIWECFSDQLGQLLAIAARHGYSGTQEPLAGPPRDFVRVNVIHGVEAAGDD